MIDVIKKLENLRKDRGLTIYKLTQIADISQQTYHNWLDGKSMPSLYTLNNILTAMGISLGEFFMEGNFIEVTKDIKKFFDNYKCLDNNEKESVNQIAENYLRNRKK